MYYKVDAYQSEELGQSNWLCEIIVYKKRFVVYELLTNEPVSIRKGNTILGNKKTDGKMLTELANYKKSIFINSYDINKKNIATKEDIEEYIDESENNPYIEFIEMKKIRDEENRKYQGF